MTILKSLKFTKSWLNRKKMVLDIGVQTQQVNTEICLWFQKALCTSYCYHIFCFFGEGRFLQTRCTGFIWEYFEAYDEFDNSVAFPLFFLWRYDLNRSRSLLWCFIFWISISNLVQKNLQKKKAFAILLKLKSAIAVSAVKASYMFEMTSF